MRRALDKVAYTSDLKERQINLRKFLRRFPCIKWKELSPFGFSIDVSTIPEENFEEFLEIANSAKV